MTSQATTEVFNQLNDLLNQLNPHTYTENLPVLNNSSIGQHVRHTLEFFQCLINGTSTGIVDYDGRERNLLIETGLIYTQKKLAEIEATIKTETNLNRPLLVKVSYSEKNYQLVESNFMRELVYMIEHSIHHFALIRIGVQEHFRHIQIDPTFGVAYSTIRYKQQLEALEN
jgi:hypothetical protein